MTVPMWCLVVVAMIPYGLAIAGDYFRKTMLGSIDNSNPRDQAAVLTGAGARSYAAQANAWEALPFFAVAVILAHLTGGDSYQSAIASVLFVIARLFHVFFYIAGFAMLRSLSFMLSLGFSVWLFVVAASA